MFRSRREVSNECLLAKIGLDTAENEPCRVCPKSAPLASFLAQAGTVFDFDTLATRFDEQAYLNADRKIVLLPFLKYFFPKR